MQLSTTRRRAPRARIVARIATGLAVLGVLAGCGGADPGVGAPSTAPTTTASEPSTARPPSTAASTPETTPLPSGPSAAVFPPFASTVEPVTVERLGVTWRPGCPVDPADLRLVTVTYATFDGRAGTGEIVLNAQVVDDVVAAFAELYAARFPIHKMVTMEVYGGVDGAAGQDNNSSGFNCRNVRGTDRWSQHSYGLAVDINPLHNPYLVGGEIRPPAGEAYLDRADERPGMIVEGDVVFRAFTSRGFEWGGYFVTTPDYQHFALPR